MIGEEPFVIPPETYAQAPGLRLEPYLDQVPLWPQAGRHILAQSDAESILVYQAYQPEIAEHAVRHQRFGGAFSFSRMSWIKPNFLWMMYRSAWATQEGQEHILAVRIPRTLFEDMLAQAVASSFTASGFSSHDDWKQAVEHSEVRLQWDPDHAPSGRDLPRRAIQLGLRGDMLRRYAERELISITDITPLVAAQRNNTTDGRLFSLVTPRERVFHPVRENVAGIVGLDAFWKGAV